MVTRGSGARPWLPRAFGDLPRTRSRACVGSRGNHAHFGGADGMGARASPGAAAARRVVDDPEYRAPRIELRHRRGAVLSRGNAAGNRDLVDLAHLCGVALGTEVGARRLVGLGVRDGLTIRLDLRVHRGPRRPDSRSCLDQSAQLDLHEATLTLDEALPSLSGYRWRAKSRRGSHPSPSRTSPLRARKIASS